MPFLFFLFARHIGKLPMSGVLVPDILHMILRTETAYRHKNDKIYRGKMIKWHRKIDNR